jgi:hypothetical protein
MMIQRPLSATYRLPGSETGAVLATGLLFLAILSLLVATAVSTTSIAVEVSGNHKSLTRAFYSAESGLHEALARLNATSQHYIGDPAASPDPQWSAYVLTDGSWQATDDPTYDATSHNYMPTADNPVNTTVVPTSLQDNLRYWIKVKHKREYDAEQAGHTPTSTHYYDNDGNLTTHTTATPGNVVYYGYANPAAPTTPVQYTGPTLSTLDIDQPVEKLLAYGYDGRSVHVIEAEAVRAPGPLIVAVIYTKQNLTGNGGSLYVDGNDNCGTAPALPPIYTLSPAVTNLSGNPPLDGNPNNAVSGPRDLAIADFVRRLNIRSTVLTEDQSGVLFGAPNHYVTVYSNTAEPLNVDGLKIQNTTGYGLLLVQGDLILGGGFDWNGLILVTGTLTLNGGGAGINIRGAVLANRTADINGSIDVRYASCHLLNLYNTLPYKIISWKEQ